MNKITELIILILLVGTIFRLFLTSSGNFIFNMDNARDMVDVREMIELKKFRLTGPTSAINGLYNGPLWYYLLAIPYILSGGDPYAAIIMEIILWAIGGYFLLRLVKDFGKWIILPIGLVWVTSNYVVLANLYSFNPNPVILLTPLLIYATSEYVKNKKGYWIILAWFLAGAFFNFEMNAGVFTPLIILVSIFLTNKKLFKDKYFWMGVQLFILTLVPQVLFDIKYNFAMSKSVISFLSENKGGFNLLLRVIEMKNAFLDVFRATLMNQKMLVWAILILAVVVLKRVIFHKEKNIIALVASLFIIIPFLGYIVIPVTVNAWHLGAPAAAALVFIGFIIANLWRAGFLGKVTSLILSVVLIYLSIGNIMNFFVNDFRKPNLDPSSYRNEIAAIEYVYQYAKGKDFKAYTYLPSVYDYPYQYLFWWYGLKKYGYLPVEYAYLPNKPVYIPSQDKFQGKGDNFSGLVFLIKEPNLNYTRFGWEGNFINLKNISKQMIGPLEVEIKSESRNSN